LALAMWLCCLLIDVLTHKKRLADQHGELNRLPWLALGLCFHVWRLGSIGLWPQDQFKTQIYTAMCLALSIGVFLLMIYVILPGENVEVPDEIDPLKQMGKARTVLDGKG